MKSDLYNTAGTKVGTVDLPDRLFAATWKPDLVYQALRVQETNRRHNYAHAKDRSEVSGGGRKPWAQKGTGRARHGSIRSPIWSGGGVTHGPRKEKVYSLKISKKMRQGAMFAILSKRLAEGEVKLVEPISIAEPKTKLLEAVLKTLVPKGKVLFVVDAANKNVFKAASNIVRADAIDAKSLSVYDLLRPAMIVIEKPALETLEKHYHALS